MSYDVRAVANLVLDLAREAELSVTNMQVNKIVYFLHADYLGLFSQSLVSAKIGRRGNMAQSFESYIKEFKSFGDEPANQSRYLHRPALWSTERCNNSMGPS